MRFHPVTLVCLLALGSLLSITWIYSIHEDTESYGEIQTLYKRLLEVEAAGVKVHQELHRALESLGNFSRPNKGTNRPIATTGQPRQQPDSSELQATLLLPNIFTFLPHLKEHADSLTAMVALGQGRSGVSLVLGVPTVRREKQSYLVNTVSSLLYNLTPSQCQDLLIIIFVAETDLAYVHTVADTISKSFPKEANSGLLEVVSPPQSFYPDFTTLHETLGDSMERVKWRTKQTLDFSFLMLYAQDKGRYYVQLEDDIVATTDYYDTIKKYAIQQSSHHWLLLEFSQLGFIGKMFHTYDLQMIAEFFLMFYKDKPIDWLLDHILWVKVCHPERDADKDFAKQVLFKAHSNPPAELSTSLVHYQEHTLSRAYQGLDFFWGFTPIRGDHVTIRFAQPTHIKRYLFRSGNFETHLDKFYNTTVEVLPRNASVYEELTVGSPAQYIGSDEGFIVIGDFQGGMAEGNIDVAMQPISALRLMVHTDSDAWILLSEVFIEV